MATNRPEKNSIVAINDKEKKIIVYGDLTDPQFRSLIEINKPDGYIVELWKAPKSEKQKANAAALSEKNDSHYHAILSDSEKEIYEAIKHTQKGINSKGNPTYYSFAYARKWVDDGKQIDADGNPVVNQYKYKGTGDNRVKEIVGTITIKIK